MTFRRCGGTLGQLRRLKLEAQLAGDDMNMQKSWFALVAVIALTCAGCQSSPDNSTPSVAAGWRAPTEQRPIVYSPKWPTGGLTFGGPGGNQRIVIPLQGDCIQMVPDAAILHRGEGRNWITFHDVQAREVSRAELPAPALPRVRLADLTSCGSGDGVRPRISASLLCNSRATGIRTSSANGETAGRPKG